ncbi:hypothetical protein FHR94_002219 [Halomonas cerina]|uniref:CENP-V/GFA domain-containing protein n=1 Tax=Halomonas cerina TaxID=447424 RepID=A0A839VAI4_9GAMM|nr:hypothetical protein [Halomonas cerina]
MTISPLLMLLGLPLVMPTMTETSLPPVRPTTFPPRRSRLGCATGRWWTSEPAVDAGDGGSRQVDVRRQIRKAPRLEVATRPGGDDMLLEGSCHCGAVRFSVDSLHPYPYQRCYCSICCKTAGDGGYAINLSGRAETLRARRGKTTSASPATLRRASPSGTDDWRWRRERNNTGGCSVLRRDDCGGHSSPGVSQRALCLRRYTCLGLSKGR